MLWTILTRPPRSKPCGGKSSVKLEEIPLRTRSLKNGTNERERIIDHVFLVFALLQSPRPLAGRSQPHDPKTNDAATTRLLNVRSQTGIAGNDAADTLPKEAI